MYYLCAISELPSFIKYYQVLNLLNFGTLCDTFLILELLEKIKKKSGKKSRKNQEKNQEKNSKKSQISSQNKTTPTAITNPTI